MGCPKPYKTHRHPQTHYRHLTAVQREEIQFHPSEHRHKFPQGNPEKPLVQPHPQGADFKIKRSHNLLACRKETPNTAI